MALFVWTFDGVVGAVVLSFIALVFMAVAAANVAVWIKNKFKGQ